MLLVGEELLDVLRGYCQSAWSVDNVYYGIPRIEVTTYPHAVIRLLSVPAEILVGCTEQIYTFEIIYRGAWGTDASFNTELTKISQVNAFISFVMSQDTLGGIGLLPTVSDVTFIEADDPNEPYYEFVITVTCVVHSPWSPGD